MSYSLHPLFMDTIHYPCFCKLLVKPFVNHAINDKGANYYSQNINYLKLILNADLFPNQSHMAAPSTLSRSSYLGSQKLGLWETHERGFLLVSRMVTAFPIHTQIPVTTVSTRCFSCSIKQSLESFSLCQSHKTLICTGSTQCICIPTRDP